MSPDTIREEFRRSALPPREALRAAVAHADALAPEIYDLVQRFCRGVCLLPEDERLLMYGLHVLAAARHDGLWPRLVDLARAPEEELEAIFDFHAQPSLATLMVSAWDGDAEGLMRLIEHADMCDDAKWALFHTLARLTFDGRIAREKTAAFLERFEREGLADDDSMVWWGWESCVADLGFVELEAALARAWEKPAYEHLKQEDRDEVLAGLQAATLAPTDPAPFAELGIAAISDPGAALEWMERRAALYRQWAAEDARAEAGSESKPSIDPAEAVRLSDVEFDWLGRFLVSRQVPASTMPIEMLDGLLTAIAIGPCPKPVADILPLIWSESGETPAWDGDDQAAYVAGLIGRCLAAISARAAVGASHRPVISPHVTEVELGSAWAEGFALGMEAADEQWTLLFENRRGAEEALEVMALCEGDTEFLGRVATPQEKIRIVERLPRILENIAAYWRDPARIYPTARPLRVQRIGRNDPCPCGSGKKYKKCCGLNPPVSA